MKWQQKPLGEFAVARGGSVDPSKFKNETFELLSIPAYDAGSPDICLGAKIGSSKKCVEPNDVLISKIVPHIRRCWIVPTKNEHRQIASGEWIQFRTEKLIPEFLRHFLISEPFHRKFMGTITGVGGSLLRARPADVYKFKIPLPPLAEQKRIAAILDAADALRAKRQQALAHLDDLLQSTFLTLFGDPVTNPMGWKVATLDEVANLITGFAFKSQDFKEAKNGIRLCRGINVGVGKLTWNDRADWDSTPNTGLNKFSLKLNDIILAMDRPWINSGFKVAQVTEADLPAYLVQRVARIRALDPSQQPFIYASLNHVQFERHCSPTETTIPHISPKDLRTFPLFKTPLPLQQRFAAIVGKIEAQKARHRAHLAELDTLFASLQSRAFSGEL